MANVFDGIYTLTMASGASTTGTVNVATMERFGVFAGAGLATAVLEATFDGTTYASVMETVSAALVVTAARITPVTNVGFLFVRLRTPSVAAAPTSWTLSGNSEKG